MLRRFLAGDLEVAEAFALRKGVAGEEEVGSRKKSVRRHDQQDVPRHCTTGTLGVPEVLQPPYLVEDLGVG
jgi:hypothetical protein